MRGIFCGDFHYGLSIEDVDRTPEVDRAFHHIIDYAIANKVDFVSIGGDTTDNNTPHPEVLALLIVALNRLEDAEIPTFIMRGNHEAVIDPVRKWGLTPLERVGYNNIHFIKESTLLEFNGEYFAFMPHATRSQLVDTEYRSVQEFIDAEAERLLEEAGKKKVTAITHYNLMGAVAGTDAQKGARQ